MQLRIVDGPYITIEPATNSEVLLAKASDNNWYQYLMPEHRSIQEMGKMSWLRDMIRVRIRATGIIDDMYWLPLCEEDYDLEEALGVSFL